MTAINIKIPSLHDGQRLIVQHPVRFKVAACGRRFGKTMLAGYWLALRKDGKSAISGNPVAYFAPTYKLLLDLWTELERTLRPVINKANRTDMRMTLITGGKLDFWTLEDIDAGRGRKYAKVVIDEAAHARYLKDVWERAIAPTLTDMHGEAWFISTPRGMNFFHQLHERNGASGYEQWASFHMPSTVNPHLDVAEIEGKRSELPELVFRQEYLAEFVTFGAGLVKPNLIALATAPPRLRMVLGVDLAISEKQSADWTAIVVMCQDPNNGIIYIVEVERYRCGFNESLNLIKAAAARHSPVMIAIEQTQFQSAVVQELTRTTKLPIRGVRPDRDKLTRFVPLLTRYEQGMVRHDPARVPSWFREELLAFPEGQHDDGVDAAGYAFAMLPSTTAGTLTTVKTEQSGWT